MYNIGDIITLKEFCFVNKNGGTGLSNCKYDEQFTGVAQIEITKAWDDYETGNKGWGKAISVDLIEYLKRNAKQEMDIHTSPIDENDKIYIPANTVFWSEFDIIEYHFKKK